MKSIHDVIKSGLCLGCGVCRYEDSLGDMIYSWKWGRYLPELRDSGVEKAAAVFAVCPGKGYSIIARAKELYENDALYNIDLGYVHKVFAVHSNSDTILKSASSGGIITELAFYLLKKKIVEKAVVTKFVYTQEGVRTKTVLTNSYDDLLEAQGSKYCPVNISEVLKEMECFNGKVGFIGTPCQVAGVRSLQKETQKLQGNKIITIANFCGGYKDYNNIRRLAKIQGIKYEDISYLRFRGGGQPGSLVMSDLSGKRIQIPYPKYVGYTGYSRLLRCRLCVDATAELADVACGDAWLPRFENTPSPWSIVITRNSFASRIIEQMIEDRVITAEPITLQEVLESQKLNIRSTKYRQTSRMRLYKMLGYKVPAFDGGYRSERTSLTTEITVYIKHKLTLFLESIGIYYLVYHHLKLKHK
jgi:coenzyme F420 hydrogenase subunit beta